MRYLRYLILATIALVLVVVALANRDTVTLHTLPQGMAEIPGMGVLTHSIALPLFVVIFGGILAGVALGFIWEWLREHRQRAEASRKAAEVARLERELNKVKGQRDAGKDEVLALLDNPN